MNISLEDIKGIGPKTAEKLRDKGILSPIELATMKPEELMDILNITRKQAKDILLDAENKALSKAIRVHTAEEISEYRRRRTQYISTGSTAVDRILGGGVPTDAITGLMGEFSVGKSQWCYQLAVNMVKMGRRVAWIETEPNTFSSKRLLEIAKYHNVKLDLNKDIYVIPSKFIFTPHHQYLAYKSLDQKMEKENLDIGLLVVDSFSAKFRQAYSGREMLPDRTWEIAKHIGYLEMLASKYNMAIVITVQVMGVPDIGQQHLSQMKYGFIKRPSGGDFLMHSASIWVSLYQRKTNLWTATVVDSAYLPKDSADFLITKKGIEDYDKSRSKI